MKKIFAVLLLGLLLAAPASVLAEGSKLPGGRWMMMDHMGRMLTDSDLQGQFLLIYFGYTFCPDICPTSLNTVADAMDILGEKASEQVQPLFITVDPDRDTVPHLRDYVKAFHPKLLGMTGSQMLVDHAMKAFKIRAEKVDVDPDDPNTYAMDHTASLFLMGPDGKFVTKFLHGATADAIAARIKEML